MLSLILLQQNHINDFVVVVNTGLVNYLSVRNAMSYSWTFRMQYRFSTMTSSQQFLHIAKIYLIFLRDETVKFSITDFSNKCEQICWKLSIGSHTIIILTLFYKMYVYSGTSLALRRLIISLSQYNVQILCWAKAA